MKRFRCIGIENDVTSINFTPSKSYYSNIAPDHKFSDSYTISDDRGMIIKISENYPFACGSDGNVAKFEVSNVSGRNIPNIG